jgi:hypothetical protein
MIEGILRSTEDSTLKQAYGVNVRHSRLPFRSTFVSWSNTQRKFGKLVFNEKIFRKFLYLLKSLA